MLVGFVILNEVEGGTFREEKSTRMSLCFSAQQEICIEEGQENSINPLTVGEASVGTSRSWFLN